MHYIVLFFKVVEHGYLMHAIH